MIAVKVGDRVGIPFLYSSCQACEFCISGWETLCIHQKNAGFTVDGCLRDYVVARDTSCIPIPSNVSFTEIARKLLKSSTILL